MLDQPFPQVIAHRCTWAESTIVALHNLGGGPVAVPLSLTGESKEVAVTEPASTTPNPTWWRQAVV